MVDTFISLGHPLVIMGDFNVVVSSDEKQGGKTFKETREVHYFRNFTSNSGMILMVLLLHGVMTDLDKQEYGSVLIERWQCLLG